MSKKLRECLKDAEKKSVAIGHFNVSNLEGVKAVVEVAQEMNLPIIIGLSEGERNFFGVKEAVAIVKVASEKTGLPIFLNADHTHSFEKAKEAIDAGFDSITADGSKLSLEENIAFVKKCMEYVQSTGRDVLVEGELGYIGDGSEIRKELPANISFDETSLTDPEVAVKLVRESGCDLLAPAVGNMHGMLASGVAPKLNISRIETIKNATGVPLVLHGGSGSSEDDFKNAVKAGCAVIHINTELRLAYRTGLEKGLINKDEVAIYKYEQPAIDEMKKVVREKLKVFNNL